MPKAKKYFFDGKRLLGKSSFNTSMLTRAIASWAVKQVLNMVAKADIAIKMYAHEPICTVKS